MLSFSIFCSIVSQTCNKMALQLAERKYFREVLKLAVSLFSHHFSWKTYDSRYDVIITANVNPWIVTFSLPSPHLYRHELIWSVEWRHNGRDSVSNHQPHDCLLNRLFRRRSKKTSKLDVTGFCAGNSSVTGEFPVQMASNAENVSIWWRHHVLEQSCTVCWYLVLKWVINCHGIDTVNVAQCFSAKIKVTPLLPN